jgi:hypothetical protein
MKVSRAAVNGVVNGVLVTALSWMLLGCSDSSPLTSTAPQPGVRASVTTATASSTEFNGFINFCHASDFSYFTAAGRTVHFGVSNENRWVAGNPLIDGTELNTGRAIIDPHGLVVNLDNSLKPDAVNGTWEIKQQFRIPDGTTSGVGHGTGDLQGMTLKFTTDPIAGAVSDCNPNDFKAGVHGVILSPAS